MNFQESFKGLIESTVRETGKQLGASAQELALYATERAQYLSTIVGQPGFDEAVAAERDNVALRAGIAVIGNADAADQRVIGVIAGALAIAAQAL